MQTTVFFSWQADTPRESGRQFIERALERAAKRIGHDTDVEEAVRELQIDRDTKGAPGSPPVVETIFRKIDKAAVFVPDLTFVGNRRDGRPTPNPNVLVEYGWALKSLGYSRIIPVMNTAFGKPSAETMPFDMIHLRHPIQYSCSDGSEESCELELETLAGELEQKILDVLKSDEFKTSTLTVAKSSAFARQEAKYGAARFRLPGEPLGIAERSIGSGAEEIKLSDGAAMWLRVMPGRDPGRKWPVADVRKVATERGLAMPLCNAPGGYGYMRAHDGFGVYRSDSPPDITCDVVFLFATGEIWTIDAYYLQAAAHANAIPFVEPDFAKALKSYGELLTRLGVTPPFTWIAGMENVKGRGLDIPSRSGNYSLPSGPRGRCLVDTVVEEGYHSPGDAPTTSLRPFFTRLFDSCGLERPEWLDGAA